MTSANRRSSQHVARGMNGTSMWELVESQVYTSNPKIWCARNGPGRPTDLSCRRDRQVAVLDRPMIPLQHDRPRLLLMAVERPASGSRNVHPADHLFAVEHHRHHPAD